MATISKNILPIPESIVVGSGSYTVPSNKYGYLAASARTTIASIYGNSPTSCASANALEQWLPAGTSISTSISAPAGTVTSVGYFTYLAFAILLIGSTQVLVSISRTQNYAQSSTQPMYYSSDASVGWSVSLFPIPINNLPSSLVT